MAQLSRSLLFYCITANLLWLIWLGSYLSKFDQCKAKIWRCKIMTKNDKKKTISKQRFQQTNFESAWIGHHSSFWTNFFWFTIDTSTPWIPNVYLPNFCLKCGFKRCKPKVIRSKKLVIRSTKSYPFKEICQNLESCHC